MANNNSKQSIIHKADNDLVLSNNKQADNIKDVIYEIRGQKVMLDRDLAVI